MKQRKPIDPRVQIGLAAALPLLLLLLGWFVLVKPQGGKAASVDAQIAQVEAQIMQNQAAARAAMHPEPILSADVFRLATAMPDTTDMPGIILQLNQVAAESGIAFASITPEPTPVTGAGYTTLKIDLTFSGNFYGLSDFLYRLRSLVGVRSGTLTASGRLFSVEKLAFAEGKPSFPAIDASLTVDAYVYGTLPVPGAAPVPVTPPASGETTTTSTDTTATTTTTAGATAAPAPGATN